MILLCILEIVSVFCLLLLYFVTFINLVHLIKFRILSEVIILCTLIIINTNHSRIDPNGVTRAYIVCYSWKYAQSFKPLVYALLVFKLTACLKQERNVEYDSKRTF